MTEISFHLNIAQLETHTLRLLHKVWRSQPKVALVGSEDFLHSVSTALWAQTPSAFVPHCWAQDELRMQEAGCLVLAEPQDMAAISPQFEVLIKVAQGSEPAPGFERFARLVELGPADGQAVADARQRWRHYQRRG